MRQLHQLIVTAEQSLQLLLLQGDTGNLSVMNPP